MPFTLRPLLSIALPFPIAVLLSLVCLAVPAMVSVEVPPSPQPSR